MRTFSWLLLFVACGGSEPSSPAEPRPDLRIVAITDLQGYLEPCGCTSRPLGGIDRLAQRFATLSAETPTLFVAAGDLWLAPQAHGPGAETQERWRAETLSEILKELGLDALAPGPADLREGPDRFFAHRARLGAPVVAAGARVGDEALPAIA